MMSDLHAMTDDELGDARSPRSAPRLAWPTTPDVAPPRSRRRSGRSKRRPSLVAPRLSLPSRRRTLLVLVAAVLALAGAALAARLVFELGAVAVDVVPGRGHLAADERRDRADLGREVSLGDADAHRGVHRRAPGRARAARPRSGSTKPQIDLEPGEVARRIVDGVGAVTQASPRSPATSRAPLLMQFEGEWEVAAKQLFAETDRYGDVIVDGPRPRSGRRARTS